MGYIWGMENRTFKVLDYMSRPFLAGDGIRFLLGDYIASGSYRSVYNFDLIPDTVIKVASDTYANIVEWEVWKSVKGTKLEKWFAPCHFISPEGYFLIQSKTKPIEETNKLPRYVPGCFSDLKSSNWGFIGDKLVCHDYQFIDRSINLASQTRRQFTKGKLIYQSNQRSK